MHLGSLPNAMLGGNLAATYSGTVVRGVSVFADLGGHLSDGKTAYLNGIVVNNDNVDASGAQGGGATALFVGDNMAGRELKGGRTALGVDLRLSVPTSNRSGNHFYVAFAPGAEASSNDNGTPSLGHGNLFASNPLAILKSGATYWNSVVGEEIDYAAEAGASVAFKEGMKIVLLHSDATPGSVADFALGIGAQAGISSGGAHNGIVFGGPEGWWPINATQGTLIGTLGPGFRGGPSYAAANGVDFSAVTFSRAAFRSPGFRVDGAGNTAAATLSAGETAPRAQTAALALASGKFAEAGDAQSRVLLLRGASSNRGGSRLTTDGGAPNAGNVINIPDATAYAVHSIVIVGRDETMGDGAVLVSGLEGLLTRSHGAGSTVWTATAKPTIVSQGNNSTQASISLAADTANGGLALTVVAPNADVWHWVARVETVEVQ